MMPAPPAPESLGEVMTVQQFRAIEAGKTIRGEES